MNWILHLGNALDVLRTLPSESAQACVTSPPYWGLRDYGHADQLGLEPTPDAFVAAMVAVFSEARRVLRDDGVLWLNLGSSYMGHRGGPQGVTGQRASNTFTANQRAFVRDNDPIQSRQRQRVPAYGNDGKLLPGSTGADFACSDLCDGCLADFQTHHDRIAGSGLLTGQCAQQPSLTGRDTAPTDSVSASPGASPLDVQASNTLESWRQHRAACSRCDSRASALSALRSSSADAQASSGMSWVNYTSRLKHKDMVPIPWIVAMALQYDGWYLRSDVIWSKPNPMPESIKDRPTKAHESVFLLSKSSKYWYDQDAIREPYVRLWDETNGGSMADGKQDAAAAQSGLVGQAKAHRGAYPMPKKREVYTGQSTKAYADACVQDPSDTKRRVLESMEKYQGANVRSVWTISTEPSPYEHFAVMPKALARRCILSGCPVGGTVLDPFAGMATTGVVALEEARSFIGIELSEKYHAIARKRLQETMPLLAHEASA